MHSPARLSPLSRLVVLWLLNGEPRPLRGTGLFPIDPSFQALLFPFLQNNLKKSSFQPHVWPLICSRLRVHFSVSVHLVYLRVSHLSLFPALPPRTPAPSHSGGDSTEHHTEKTASWHNLGTCHMSVFPVLGQRDSPRPFEG